MSIDARAQVAIILLAFGPCVVVVYGWDRFCIWVEFPVQRRLCPIFKSGVGYPTSRVFHGLTGCQRDTPVLGRQIFCMFITGIVDVII